MSTPRVESYSFGQMVVDGQKHTNDLILLPHRVVPNWWREEGHRLSSEDLQDVLAARPDVLVVGTGAHGVMEVPQQTRKAVSEAGIDLRIADTGKAWRLYNEEQARREAAGAFHLTC